MNPVDYEVWGVLQETTTLLTSDHPVYLLQILQILQLDAYTEKR